jgi:CheY-like chemotaxis protein/UDP-2,3-diacylglucosamine pyrophosphatase LpxH
LTGGSMASPRVLIVEDDPLWIDWIKSELKKVPAAVNSENVVVLNPDRAETELRGSKFDLIISDYMFKDSTLNTPALIELLRKLNLPVVVVSNNLTVKLAAPLVNRLPVIRLFDKGQRDGLDELLKDLFADVAGGRTSAETRADSDVRLDGERVFSWIHVSDVHFGAGAQRHRFDQQAVGAALVADAMRAPRADAVFVTGDVAFRAAEDEYRTAASFFTDLEAAAQVDKSKFYFVPGNHDVDRRRADEVSANSHHEAARRSHARIDIDDILHEEKVRRVLLEKLEAYRAFIGREYPAHPSSGADELDWATTIPCTAGGERRSVRLVGLSTVWVSDSLDGRRSRDDNGFEPNMLLAHRQLAIIDKAGKYDVLLVLSHHPPAWLASASRETLERYLVNKPYVHLCGHVHRKAARVSSHLGDPGGTLRFVAGAAHEGEDNCHCGEHTYSWGALRWRQGRWQVGWAPRVYVPERNEMRADRTRHDLDADGFAWTNTSWLAT